MWQFASDYRGQTVWPFPQSTLARADSTRLGMSSFPSSRDNLASVENSFINNRSNWDHGPFRQGSSMQMDDICVISSWVTNVET